MKIAINTKHRGKMPLAAGRSWWGVYNGQFENVDLTVAELVDSIQQGNGYSTQHEHYRKAANFICGQHLGLDFDTENEQSTIEALRNDPLIARYATIIHTTASHAPEKPRARVLFILDRPIATAAKYTLLATSLLDKYGQADQSTKDACRLFFGAEGCAVEMLGNILSLEAAADLFVRSYQAKQAVSRVVSSNGKKLSNGQVPRDQLTSHSDMLLSKVAAAPDGQKYYTLRDISRTFGGYIKSGYYEEAEVCRWLQDEIKKRPTVKSLSAAYQTIDDGLAYGRLDPLHFEIEDTPEDEPVTITPDPSWQGVVLEGVM